MARPNDGTGATYVRVPRLRSEHPFTATTPDEAGSSNAPVGRDGSREAT